MDLAALGRRCCRVLPGGGDPSANPRGFVVRWLDRDGVRSAASSAGRRARAGQHVRWGHDDRRESGRIRAAGRPACSGGRTALLRRRHQPRSRRSVGYPRGAGVRRRDRWQHGGTPSPCPDERRRSGALPAGTMRSHPGRCLRWGRYLPDTDPCWTGRSGRTRGGAGTYPPQVPLDAVRVGVQFTDPT